MEGRSPLKTLHPYHPPVARDPSPRQSFSDSLRAFYDRLLVHESKADKENAHSRGLSQRVMKSSLAFSCSPSRDSYPKTRTGVKAALKMSKSTTGTATPSLFLALFSPCSRATINRLEYFVEQFETAKPALREHDKPKRPPARSRLLRDAPPKTSDDPNSNEVVDSGTATSPPPPPKKFSAFEPAPDRPTYINPSPSLLQHKISALRSSLDSLKLSIRESGDEIRGSIEGAKRAARATLKHQHGASPDKTSPLRASIDVVRLRAIRASFTEHSSMSLRRSMSLRGGDERRRRRPDQVSSPRSILLGKLGSESFRDSYLSLSSATDVVAFLRACPGKMSEKEWGLVEKLPGWLRGQIERSIRR